MKVESECCLDTGLTVRLWAWKSVPALSSFPFFSSSPEHIKNSLDTIIVHNQTHTHKSLHIFVSPLCCCVYPYTQQTRCAFSRALRRLPLAASPLPPIG